MLVILTQISCLIDAKGENMREKGHKPRKIIVEKLEKSKITLYRLKRKQLESNLKAHFVAMFKLTYH